MFFINGQYIFLIFNIIISFLAVCHGVRHVDFQRRNTIYSRNVAQFGALILDTIGNPFAYYGYGCWCGRGHRGELVVDATDRCCQMHDRCWQSVKDDIDDCNPYWRFYSYKKMSNGNIRCTDPVGTCDYRSCRCDKIAVECFARHRNTTYNPDFDNWQGICDETSNKPEDDPDRCPPVWNKREKYSRNSFVSINGITYRALHSSGPGENPKNNLYGSYILGTVATWKKLERCRRTDTADNF